MHQKSIDDYILKKRRSKVYKIWNVQLKARWLESVLLTRQENSTMRHERRDMTGNPRGRKTGVSSSNNRSLNHLNYRTIRLSHWSRRNRTTRSYHWRIRIQWRQQRPRCTTETHRWSRCCPLSTSIEICTCQGNSRDQSPEPVELPWWWQSQLPSTSRSQSMSMSGPKLWSK